MDPVDAAAFRFQPRHWGTHFWRLVRPRQCQGSKHKYRFSAVAGQMCNTRNIKHEAQQTFALKNVLCECFQSRKSFSPTYYMKKLQNSLSDERVRWRNKTMCKNEPMDLINSSASELRTMSMGLLAPNTIHKLIIKQNDSMQSSAQTSMRQAVPMLLPYRNNPRRLRFDFVSDVRCKRPESSVEVWKARLR